MDIAEGASVAMYDNEAVFMSSLPYFMDEKYARVGNSYEDVINNVENGIRSGDDWQELMAGTSRGGLDETISNAIGNKVGLPQMSDEYTLNFLEQWKGNSNLQGYQLVGIESHEGQDPYAFVFKKGDDLVIAFRGTENGKEWWDDGKMAYDTKNSQALKDAVNTVDKYSQQYPECSITTTGHSRGGTMSMFAAIERPDVVDKCFSVEGMSLPQSYINERAGNIAQAKDHMVSLNAENDFCNHFGQNPCGEVKFFKCDHADGNFLAGHMPFNILNGTKLTEQVDGPNQTCKTFHNVTSAIEKYNPDFYKYGVQMFCAAVPIFQGENSWQRITQGVEGIGHAIQATGEYNQKLQAQINGTKENLNNFVNGFVDKAVGMDIANVAIGPSLSPGFKDSVFAPAFNSLSQDLGMNMMFGENKMSSMLDLNLDALNGLGKNAINLGQEALNLDLLEGLGNIHNPLDLGALTGIGKDNALDLGALEGLGKGAVEALDVANILER